MTYRFADKIIGISKELSKDLEKLSSSKVDTIYNPSYEEKNITKKNKRKLGKKINTILCVARLEKQKNHIMLLKAYKESLNLIDSKLILIGYGSEKQNILSYKKKIS